MSSDKKIENLLFIQRLKELMKEKKYTQQTLSDYSKKIGCYVSRKTIGLWCIGRAYPTRKNIEFLCKTLEVTPEYLFGETNFRNKEDMLNEWNKNVSCYSADKVKQIEALYEYLDRIGIKHLFYSEPTEQPKIKDVLIGDKQSYSVEYSYNDMSIEYFDFENDELLEKIEQSIKNLIFSNQIKNKGESKNGSGKQT